MPILPQRREATVYDEARPEASRPSAGHLERDATNETSDEPFDRTAFAHRALDLVRPPGTTVAICVGSARMYVECGRAWRGISTDARWAMLAIPPRASRRAIALAVAQLAPAPRPYALDVLIDEANAAARARDAE